MYFNLFISFPILDFRNNLTRIHLSILHLSLLEEIFIVYLLNRFGYLCRMLTEVQPLLPADKSFMIRVYLWKHLGDSGGGAEVGGLYEGCRINQVENLKTWSNINKTPSTNGKWLYRKDDILHLLSGNVSVSVEVIKIEHPVVFINVGAVNQDR